MSNEKNWISRIIYSLTNEPPNNPGDDCFKCLSLTAGFGSPPPCHVCAHNPNKTEKPCPHHSKYVERINEIEKSFIEASRCLKNSTVMAQEAMQKFGIAARLMRGENELLRTDSMEPQEVAVEDTPQESDKSATSKQDVDS